MYRFEASELDLDISTSKVLDLIFVECSRGDEYHAAIEHRDKSNCPIKSLILEGGLAISAGGSCLLNASRYLAPQVRVA